MDHRFVQKIAIIGGVSKGYLQRICEDKRVRLFWALPDDPEALRKADQSESQAGNARG